MNRGFTDEQLQHLIKATKKGLTDNEIISLNVRISGDLRRFDCSFFDYAIGLYHIYDKTGNLPYPGSTSEQPSKAIEVINIFEQLTLERKQQAIEEREKEIKRNG